MTHPSEAATPIVETAAPPQPSNGRNVPLEPVEISGDPRRERRHWLEYASVGLSAAAAIAASCAAIFSGWQVWIAKDTAERQLRPYAYISTNIDTDLQTNPDGSLALTISPFLKVFGITPAAWMSPTWDVKIFPAWAEGKFPDLPIAAGRIDLVAFPNQDYRLGSKQ